MDNQVEEIKSKIDIVTIIGERIDLKKAGRNFKANCPFHGEKTPSFMVSQELQIYKCFGCGEGGDVFNFLEKFEGMEFAEALKYLADRTGVKLKRIENTGTSERERIIEINKETLKFYKYLLTKHAEGARAYEYLQKERGLSKETIDNFDMGFSPHSSDLFARFIAKNKYSLNEMEMAGIGLVRGGRIFDRFNDRVIFPLFDHRGNPVGFSGRVLPWDKRETGKYINSPDTPAYHKSQVLYGLNKTRPNIKKKNVAIIVEGELDAISSYQAGIKNIVAIKGSALTEDQVRLLSRFANKFILALDSDMAGDAAARRGLTIAANLGIEVKIATIKNYKDPDDAARNNLESYKKDLITAKNVWDYLIDSAFARFNTETGEGKAKISKEIVPILVTIEDKIVQNFYLNKVAQKLNVSPQAVEAELFKLEKGTVTAPETIIKKEEKISGRRDILEKRLLALSFLSDPKRLLSPNFNDQIINPFNKKIVAELKKYSDNNAKIDIQEFSKAIPAELFEGFSKILLSKDWEGGGDTDDINTELESVIRSLKILVVKEQLEAVRKEMQELETKGEEKKLLEAQKKFDKLAKLRSGLEKNEEGGIILGED